VVFTGISRRTRAEARVEHRAAKAAGKPNRGLSASLHRLVFPAIQRSMLRRIDSSFCLPAIDFPAANLGFVFSIELGRTPVEHLKGD